MNWVRWKGIYFECSIIFLIFFGCQYIFELVATHSHISNWEIDLMSDVVEANLLVKTNLSSFEPVKVIFPVQHIVLLLLSIDNLPKAIFLSRGLILCLLQKYFRSLIFHDGPLVSHLLVVFYLSQCKIYIANCILIFFRIKDSISVDSSNFTKEPDSRWKIQTVSP